VIYEERLAVLALLLAVVGAFAQSDRGIITGTVADATGAMIPAAQVTLINNETGGHYETVTTATGNYNAAGPAGWQL